MKTLIALMVAITLTGCGNTITGFGKDISTVGVAVTNWQETIGEDDAKVID